MTDYSDRPFRVLGIQQVAIGGLDKQALRRFWVDVLGIEAHGTYREVAQNVDEDILRLGHGPHAVEIDLMQPIDPDKAPKVHVPPLNHVGLWVDDLHAAVTWLKQNGVRVLGEPRPGAAGHDVVFVHPKGNDAFPIGAEGVLLELVQAPPDVIDALSK